LFLNRLEHAIATGLRNHWHGALLLIDLDHFQTLNDTLGHELGDRLLQQVAQRLQTNSREADTVAHLGGDEFVVMLEG
jgi:diguanylate cyclase (GGDEF)-like protein